MRDSVTAFAPATVANVAIGFGPGRAFDVKSAVFKKGPLNSLEFLLQVWVSEIANTKPLNSTGYESQNSQNGARGGPRYTPLAPRHCNSLRAWKTRPAYPAAFQLGAKSGVTAVPTGAPIDFRWRVWHSCVR